LPASALLRPRAVEVIETGKRKKENPFLSDFYFFFFEKSGPVHTPYTPPERGRLVEESLACPQLGPEIQS
jgi:hypothetical protein